LPVIGIQQSAEPGFALELVGMLGPIWVGQDWKGNSISEALVGPFVVVMQQVFLDGLGDAGGSQQQEPVRELRSRQSS